MKMKKILSLALCSALFIGAFTGCGAKKEPVASDEKTLRVGMECAYAPFNWTQTDDSNGAVPVNGIDGEYANGYDVMIAKKIADSMGYKLEINKVEWAGLPTGVAADKLDCAIAGMSITSKRLETVDFSEPYYEAGIVAMTTKGSKYENAKSVADLDGAVCTSQLNTIWYNMLDQIPNVQKQAAIENVAAMLVSLSSGKSELIVTDMPTAMAAQYSNPNLVILEFEGENAFKASSEDVNMGIAIAKGNTELKEKIDAALAEISKEDRAEIMKQAISNQPLAQ